MADVSEDKAVNDDSAPGAEHSAGQSKRHSSHLRKPADEELLVSAPAHDSGGSTTDLTQGQDMPYAPSEGNVDKKSDTGLELHNVVAEGTLSEPIGTKDSQTPSPSRHHEGTYDRLRESVVARINQARGDRQLDPLIMDKDLTVPAMSHCRAMCEHGFLSHWDIAGHKPYQRYSDFAFGQHVTEVIFGAEVGECVEDEISAKVNEWIDARKAEEASEDKTAKTNHLLDSIHTHIAIGICHLNGKIRYVEVYADRYLELLDAPVALAVSDTAPASQISVQMHSPDVGPYTCLVFHDPVPTPLNVAELQQQFSGAYTDFTPSQVGVVWPWQMELLDGGVFEIPIAVSPIEAGTYYVQIFLHDDPASIPYEADPSGGLPLPGDSFCGAAVVLKAPEEATGELGASAFDEDGAPLADGRDATLEEREARSMASTAALRRDFAPLVRVKVVQETGGGMQQHDNYETVVFMPSERAEDMAQVNLAVKFLRLGQWDDGSSRGHSSDELGSIQNAPAEADHKAEPKESTGSASDSPEQAPNAPDLRDSANGQAAPVPRGDAVNAKGELEVDGKDTSHTEEAQKKGDEAPAGDGQSEKGTSAKAGDAAEEARGDVPLVITDLAVVTFSQSAKAEAPEGFEMISGDLADPSASDGYGAYDELGGELVDGREDEGAQGEAKTGQEIAGGADEAERDKVFLCTKTAPYDSTVRPVTDLALVYGTEGFQMGFGFVTVTLPQAVNELYGSTLHLCYKKEGASLAVIQQEAERTAKKTAKQIQQHLGIDDDDVDSGDHSIDDDAYDVDMNMTAEQMREWEEKRSEEAAERAERREQAERERRQKEANDTLQRRIEEAAKEKDQLVKENGDWQKKIAALMLTQQKTREESRTEHGGRGIEKEATPVHESEKHYADSLASIVACRERLREMQAEYDTVALSLQTRLDEKEYKSREIADSFREFKREIARTAEHSRTGKTIPKKVISQFEAAEAKKDEDIEKVRLKNIHLRMMLKKVEGKLRAKEQLAEGLHLIDFEQLKIENQTVNEKIEERNEELLKLRKKNTTTVQILTHTKEKLQFVAAENVATSQQLAALEDDLNLERDCLARAKKERDSLRSEVASLRQSQGFANSDLLILDFEQRKSHLKKLNQKLDDMRSKHHLLLLEQERLRESNEQRAHVLGLQI